MRGRIIDDKDEGDVLKFSHMKHNRSPFHFQCGIALPSSQEDKL
jgi:hypothetical protein